MQNLIDNAIKYNGTLFDRDAWVEIRQQSAAGQTIIEVESWGSVRIPDAIGQRDQSASRPGMGMGLAIVSEGVQELGGRLETEDEHKRNPNKKMAKKIFRVILPVVSG